MRFTFDELRGLALQAGFPVTALDTIAAIALAESGGDPNARATVTDPAPGNLPEDSIGLWQVNVLAWPQYSAAELFDPMTNARAALVISSGGTSFSHWSTFTTSDPRLSYTRFLPASYSGVGVGGLLALAVGVAVAIALDSPALRPFKMRARRAFARSLAL